MTRSLEKRVAKDAEDSEESVCSSLRSFAFEFPLKTKWAKEAERGSESAGSGGANQP
jgi:hypothetical protein